MPPNPLRAVIDEQMPWTLAVELRSRGYRTATSAQELGMVGKKDPVWLRFLSELPDASVLITFDNKMVDVHRAELLTYKNTVAIIDSKADRGGLMEHEYYRDVVHRWVHRMVGQSPGSLRKYTRKFFSKVEMK